MKRVLVIVNKWWECDPVMNVFLHDNARPKDVLRWPTTLNHPRRRHSTPLPIDNNPKPRAVFTLPNITCEVWCISDLLEHLPDKGRFQSSSQRKIERLSLAFQGAPPDLVIAAGTAGLPADVTENGSVVVGTRVFMHDCHPNGENPDSQWNDGPFEQLLTSSLDAQRFSRFTRFTPTVIDRLLVAPLNPAQQARILAERDFVAVGAVNVTDYTEYGRTDLATLDAFAKTCPSANAKSLETTHGLIRSKSNVPFVFVSGITDRVGHFHEEVDLRPYAQNTVAAHNAGIVIAWMLPSIDAVL
jgi:hypothetical protein